MRALTRRLIIIGAGGHGKVSADCAEQMGHYNEIAFLDGEFPALSAVGVWSVIGTCDDLNLYIDGRTDFFVAIGNNITRQKILSGLTTKACTIATLLHPSATISRYAQIGEGTIVCANTVINVAAKIGRGCIVNTSTSVDHDCQIEDYVHLAPGTRLAGDVKVGQGTFVGIGSAIIQGILLGNNCVLGAGSTLLYDLPDRSIAVGTPAKVIKQNDY